MSFQYRFHFLENLLRVKTEVAEEIHLSTNQMGQERNEEEEDEVEDYKYERGAALEHFFERVYEELSKEPYSMHFYLAFSKEMIRKANEKK